MQLSYIKNLIAPICTNFLEKKKQKFQIMDNLKQDKQDVQKMPKGE